MSNNLSIGSSHFMRVMSVEERGEPDPELRHRFSRCMSVSNDLDKQTRNGIDKTGLDMLNHDGGVVRRGSAEIMRQGDALCYRLLNGPMMGLVIQASYRQGQAVIKLFPANERQEKALNKVAIKLDEQLQARPIPVTLEVKHVGE
ncbi:hypothetical protein [Shewanella surugensis]|uniref:Uncharacterized protein n=1 Tax=Shewanella surugensis TaxID=212020 RepID=A0ABT0L7Q1_9GAMM|nr:hypothetical protein [Shewanella surugensis]MCL1123686.1 hypothetical protein [Shewanella surugensis]